jgi:hypothetical protein
MKSILALALLSALSPVHAATMLGVNLATPINRLPNCDTRSPPCLHAVAPDVYNLRLAGPPIWARGTITITSRNGQIAQVFIESGVPVHLPNNGPLGDRVRRHNANMWIYSDGATATYNARMSDSNVSDIDIEVLPPVAIVAGLPSPSAK